MFSSTGQKGFGAPVDSYSGTLDPELFERTNEKMEFDDKINEEYADDDSNTDKTLLTGVNGFIVPQNGIYCGTRTPSSFWVNPPSGLDIEDSMNSEFFFMAIPKEDDPDILDMRLYISLSASVEVIRVSIPEIPHAYVDLHQEIGNWKPHHKFLYTMMMIDSLSTSKKNQTESIIIGIIERYVQYRGEVDRRKFRAVGRHVVIKEPKGKILVSCAPDRNYFISTYYKASEMLDDVRKDHIIAGKLSREEIVYSEEQDYKEEPFDWRGWTVGILVVLGSGSLIVLGIVCVKKKLENYDEDDFE